MYLDNNGARTDKRIENAKLVKERAQEKNKVDKKYPNVLADVKKLMEEA
jgi:hypothetical protein